MEKIKDWKNKELERLYINVKMLFIYLFIYVKIDMIEKIEKVN